MRPSTGTPAASARCSIASWSSKARAQVRGIGASSGIDIGTGAR
jgi:hypothetical protein